jgi:two-component system sensor histidine kinase MtrB
MRRRLIGTTLILVGLTAAVLAAAVWLVVSGALRSQLVADTTGRVEFAAAVLAPARLDATPTLDEFVAAQFDADLRLAGDEGLYVDFGEGEPFVSGFRFSTPPDAQLVSPVADGNLAWQWTTVANEGYLVAGARTPSTGPDLYLFVPTAELDATLASLRNAAFLVGLLVIAIGGLVARRVARQVLKPVGEAAHAARKMAAGDLATRLDDNSTDEFGDWAGAFNQMAVSLESTIAQLRDSEELQRRFVADVAHELRTPVTGLVNEAELLRRQIDELPGELQRVAQLLIHDVGRLRRLVDDLLEISRLDASSDPIRPEPFDIRDFLKAHVADRLPGAVLACEPHRIVTDRRRLDRIVGNVLSNAASHAGGSKVDIESYVDNGRLTISISDRGPGFDGDLEWLFGRFSQADASRSGSGSGLGLAIARDHARSLGGDLAALHRTAGGLTFRLDIPVTELLPNGEDDVMLASHDEGER